MRLTALTILCVLTLCTIVYASDRQLRQNYTISIEVECLDTAMEIIHGLPGFNLDSSTTLGETRRSAQFRRRVSGDNLRYVQAVLRDLGDVVSEHENAQHLAARIMDLDVRISALDQELARLTAIMEASTTLDVLIAVNDRISDVSRNRDDLIGQLNVAVVESQGPIINISLTEFLPAASPAPSDAFGRRLADRFTNSLSTTRSGAESFLVGVVRITVPLVIWIGILAFVWLVVWRRCVRKRLTKIFDSKKTKPQEVKVDE